MIKRNTLNIIVVVLLCIGLNETYAQNFNYGKMIYMRNNPLKRFPSFGLGLGGNLLLGDYGSASKGSLLPTAHLSIENRFTESWGWAFQFAGGMYGEKFKHPHELLDVRSIYYTGEFHLHFYLNKILNLPLRTRFYPFIDAGFGMIGFNPMGDLKDSKGQYYFSWPDGTFRTEAWTGFNDPQTPELKRDGVYETNLDPAGEFDHIGIVFPIGLGFKYFASKKSEIVFGFKSYFSTTDHLDAFISFDDVGEPSQFNKANDVLITAYVTVYYNSGKYKKKRFKRPSRRILPSFMY